MGLDSPTKPAISIDNPGPTVQLLSELLSLSWRLSSWKRSAERYDGDSRKRPDGLAGV